MIPVLHNFTFADVKGYSSSFGDIMGFDTAEDCIAEIAAKIASAASAVCHGSMDCLSNEADLLVGQSPDRPASPDGDKVERLTSRPTKRAYPDVWDLPGGQVEAGESELQALAREMHEAA
ncbi:NUDIX domain-containing protein [Micromonospora cremea]|uniref:NUDIX domain-containing protein n=1 Tax=Micromonospora cremea TaxID=709881 RepID=A0A1N6BFI9_9ACTN|nr:NUDIX domain-containing protein [Micromonospora cremea]SIN45041.1 NUDIX domain-containing protein [Micromonospora cremea]